jgi:hypothetical protein
MDNIQYSLSPLNAKGQRFIVASKTEFDEDGMGQTMSGLLPVQPEKAQQLLEDFATGKRTVEFGRQIRGNNYEVTASKVEETVEE